MSAAEYGDDDRRRASEAFQAYCEMHSVYRRIKREEAERATREGLTST